ncbi:hypothetical protein [Streptomyces acidicola]|uniref:Uncharacterized protein n=1 Tax=Streptomyces acidicola TaxID=2596892 RepID=A0A5N8WKV0_9ACTN|nr:hypothetical protein [Streptomyces acidicola]MPY47108.1 hypothetical protein [Streptomyces acidicola]MPY47247.1 hypothetical protein [Streptomyces acidicola]
MSDDYAALITTIILAALLIGSVQLASLLRRFVGAFVESAQRGVNAQNSAIDAIQREEDPEPDDLEAITVAVRPGRVLRKAIPALAAAIIWLGICGPLVWILIKVLFWSATHEPQTDPQLAKASFYVTAGAVAVLVIEGMVRVVAEALRNMKRALNSYTPPTREQRSKLFEALARHAGTSSNEPDSH